MSGKCPLTVDEVIQHEEEMLAQPCEVIESKALRGRTRVLTVLYRTARNERVVVYSDREQLGSFVLPSSGSGRGTA